MAESTENAKPVKEKSARKIPARQILLIGGAFVAGFVLLGVIAIQVWEYSNSVPFCANFCHDVHPEEIAAFEDSYHASIKCVECHMGRVGTLHNILLKASHFRHLPEVILDNYDRPLESETMRPANESCELCHWPPAFHGDRVREITRYQPDENNFKERTYLMLKTGGGERETGLGYGIHWHIANQVEFITNGEDREEILWVRTTLPDGRAVEFNDVTNPLSPEEIAQAEKHVMECVDCHNRVGHPFPAPEDLIDQAMDEGQLSTDLPYAKSYMLDLLTADYADQQEALEAVATIREQYATTYPEAAAAFPQEIEQAEQLAEGSVAKLFFEEPGVTWQSFPDHNKHKDFAGCFRCHDGKHLADDGASIRLHCNICHSIPETVGASDRPPAVPLAYIQEPASHLDTNFMADHRFQASDECGTCHGEIAFGADDSSFCANSACHGRSWPEVELDAASPHPIELEGKHAEVWCHNCHAGVEKPSYACTNCHEPPPAHFGDTCEDCHTPDGFAESAASIVNLAPQIAHELAGRENCLQCHDPAGNIKPAPANHADYLNEQCVLCHKAGD